MKLLTITIISLFLFEFSVAAQNVEAVQEKIQEVYADDASRILDNEMLFNFYSTLINERIQYITQPYQSDEKYPKLSEIDLLNKKNPNLERDSSFDPDTFNPLKYNFNFTSSGKQLYRVDETDYLILILPQ